LTLREINKRVESEADAYGLLEQLRWPDGPVCPHCGNTKAYFLKPANGTTRATGPKKTMSQRRVWKCAACRKQFSVLTGTIFHGTKVPIQTWLMVMVQMCSAKNGISAREVERMHGVTPETAWFMLHRLREAMKRDPLAGVLRGTIVADETWVGGDPKNVHASKLAALRPEKIDAGEGRPNQHTDKTPVLALVNRETGEVVTEVVTSVNAGNIGKFLGHNVDITNSVLHTDESRVYWPVGAQFESHETVNHSQGEYVLGNVSTNRAEGFFGQLKRSIDGTHHHVSPEHLHRYVNEFAFRYSTCKLDDGVRLQRMVDQAAGRRLSYKPLTEG
jgi:transposase-like protein